MNEEEEGRMPTLGTPEVAIELGTTSSDEVEEKGYRTSGESTVRCLSLSLLVT